MNLQTLPVSSILGLVAGTALAVPSMPPGSPGMESARPVPYETLLVRTEGSSSVFARH